MRVLLLGYEDSGAMRLRLLQHLPRLEEEGHTVDVCLLGRGRSIDRIRDLPRIAKGLRAADVVVVQRVLERPVNALLKEASTPVIFDFDDALHLVRTPQHMAGNRRDEVRRRALVRYRAAVRGGALYSSRRRLLHEMSRLARVVIAGNEWLCEEVKTLTRTVMVVPTTVEVHPAQKRVHSDARPLTIGWVGTPGNLFHLGSIERAFRLIGKRYGDDVRLAVVCSWPYETDAIATQFVPWSVAMERRAVSEFDIGIMPLTNDLFVLGKCAFKAILCMSHAVPVVLSPVGANLTLVDHGVDGLFANDAEEWFAAVSELLDDIALRERLGAAGFEKVRAHYSTDQSFIPLVAALQIAASG